MKTRFFTRKLRSAVAYSLNTHRRAVWAAALILTLAVTVTLTLRPGLLTSTAAAGATSPASLPSADKHTRARVSEGFGKLPLYFVENRGQMDKRVGYYVQGSDKTIYFADQGLTFVLNGPTETRPETLNTENPQSSRYTLKLDFVGARAGAHPEGQEQTGATFSYFKGSRSKWQAGLKSYSQIVYRDLWPGIDLVYAGTVNRMKYTFVVKPGADPNQIKLAWRGASGVKLNAAGELEVKSPVGGFTDERPVSWQGAGAKQTDVPTSFRLEKQSAIGTKTGPQSAIAYGFEVGEYDRSRELVIDPAVLVYAGFIGGSGSDQGLGIAVDSAGNAYVVGITTSTQATFPVTVGPDLTQNGGTDAFVAKVNASGTALVYCGYIGGSGNEQPTTTTLAGIAVDSAGNAYVTGATNSTEASFPVTVGPDLTQNGFIDAFVAKVNASGTALDYCGYIGGVQLDTGTGIAVDSAGNAYITGQTVSTEADFPVTVGPDLTQNGLGDAFVAKVNASGTALVYCGYIGGGVNDSGVGIAVDSAGNAYIIGNTNSTEATFPVTVGPDLTHNGGLQDAFVAKVNASGTALDYCGYIGGSGADTGRGIAVDSAGNAYVTGGTISTEASFPVTVGPDLTQNGGSDAFVAKVNASGTALDYCGYIGGSGADTGTGIAVDSAGNAYVAGGTTSTEATFPVTVGPDLTQNGGSDAFVAKVNASGTVLEYCGYIGGSGTDFCNGIAVDSAGNAYVTGTTTSTEATFPVTVGPDLTANGGNDAFVAKIRVVSSNTAPVAICQNVTVSAGAGCTADVSINNGSSDPDGGDTITLSQSPAGPYPLGSTTVALTVTDSHGASSSCSAIVTVVDSAPPIISCPVGISIAGNVAGSCSANVNPGTATATDSCSSVTVAGVRSDSLALNAPYPLGTTTITWTATDGANNTASCPQTVTVTNPVPVASITGPPSGSVYAVNTPVYFTGTFNDNAGGTHNATWMFDTITQAGTVNEMTGGITATYSFTTPGVYLVKLTVTDGCGGSSTDTTVGDFEAMVVIYDPNGGFVTGGGWINSPAGAYVPNPSLTGKANFGFVSKYQNGNSVPTGNTEFHFKAGDLKFKSTSYEWLVISGGKKAQYKGFGTINGSGNYRFMLTAIDGDKPGGGGVDKFRIRIWSDGGGLVYDNQLNDPDSNDPTTVLGGGSIQIHN